MTDGGSDCGEDVRGQRLEVEEDGPVSDRLLVVWVSGVDDVEKLAEEGVRDEPVGLFEVDVGLSDGV